MARDRDFDLVDGVFDELAGRADRYGAASLSTPERVVLHSWGAKGFIDEGGFVALYERAIDFSGLAEAFDALSFTEAASACRQSLSVFPNALPLDDYDTRCQWLARNDAATRELSGDDLNNPIHALDGSLEPALAAYIREHHTEFAGIGRFASLLHADPDRTPASAPGADRPSFYVLRPYGNQLFGRRFAFAEVLDPHDTGPDPAKGVCPQCGNGLGMLTWFPPHRIKLSNTRYPDFLWGAGFDLMVSGRFRELYKAASMTGIVRFDPPAEVIKVGRKRGSEVEPPPPVYHNVTYIHGAADLNDKSSGARRTPVSCSHCRASIEAVKQVVLRPGSWNGADLFEAFGFPGSILVSERLKVLVDEHTLTGAELIPAEEYYFDWQADRRWPA